MKKIFSLVLILCMVLAMLVSCSNTGNSGDTASAETNEPSDTGHVDTFDVPDVKYDGYEYHILTAGNVAYDDFSFDEDSDIVLDSAQYQRKVKVQTDFDVKILLEIAENKSSFGNGPGYLKIQKAVDAEDYAYDLGLIGTYDVAVLAMNNYLYDLKSVKYIDLENLGGYKDANKDLDIGGLLFFSAGDLSVSNNNATFVLTFNKEMAAEIEDMKDPYQLVKDGKWTYDELKVMSKKVSADVDGNDIMNMRDKYGMVVWDDTVMAVVNSVGVRCCTIDDSGSVSLTLNDERTVAALGKWADITYDKTTAIYNQRYGSANGTLREMWEENRAMFRNTLITNVHEMRAMEADFGVLPYPKLTEDQTRYYSTLASYNGQFICMPILQEDIERSGIIAEALAYYGQQYVRSAFYEKTLYGATVRDDESIEMLDVIFSNYIYDLGWYYRVGAYNSGLILLVRAYSTDFASTYAGNEESAKTMLSNINENYKAVYDQWSKVG